MCFFTSRKLQNENNTLDENAQKVKRYAFFFLFLKRTVQSLEADPYFKRQINGEDVPLVQCMHLAFTCMPGESYCRRLNVSWLLDEQVMRRAK